MSATDLAAYVSPDAPLRGTAPAFAAECWDTAAALVAKHIGGALVGGEIDGTSGFVEDPNHPGFWSFDPDAAAGTASVLADGVPQSIMRRAILEVGAELFHRRQAPNGITQFAMPNGPAPVRVARDPLVAARDLLAPFLGPGIA